jgi:hypothetical protein
MDSDDDSEDTGNEGGQSPPSKQCPWSVSSSRKSKRKEYRSQGVQTITNGGTRIMLDARKLPEGVGGAGRDQPTSGGSDQALGNLICCICDFGTSGLVEARVENRSKAREKRVASVAGHHKCTGSRRHV